MRKFDGDEKKTILMVCFENICKYSDF